jgi:light-regulated signal transduction histidine kinase (bacteriophytochrome)
MEPVPEGTFILSKDITKEKELDEELKRHREHLEDLVVERTAQLEAVNKELEAFSYSVSHDLRAPLRHINGFIDLLNKGVSHTLDEKNRRYLTVVSQAASHMGSLIDDLLAFSRMSRAELMKTRVNLRRLVTEVITELKTAEEGRKVVWDVGTLPVVEVDPAMMRLAVLNLLANALKYTRTREEARIEVGSTRNDHETIFFVRDNGVGFDMKYVDKLFGVFQRLHRAEEFEGTGIGLANVRRIIQRHGGRTWAEGKTGEGAAFFCSLPDTTRKG